MRLLLACVGGHWWVPAPRHACSGRLMSVSSQLWRRDALVPVFAGTARSITNSPATAPAVRQQSSCLQLHALGGLHDAVESPVALERVPASVSPSADA
jgi:hypothetical protein